MIHRSTVRALLRRLMRPLAPVLTVLFFALALPAWALAPPSDAELEQLRASGQLATQAAQARKLGNHLLDPATVATLAYRTGRANGTISIDTPPPAWGGGLPATGAPKILVLLVDFPDQPHVEANTDALIEERMFGVGGATVLGYPYESLRAYYQRSSYGQLDLHGHVAPWYRARYNRAYYEGLGERAGTAAVIDEALGALQATGHPLAQYDNDKDGSFDTLFVKWAGPAGAWASFWWAKQTVYGGTQTYGGKRIRKVVWSWAGGHYNTDPLYEPQVDIHETGHALGLPDYYDYDSTVGPKGGAGGYDMMHSNLGDHNAFSKFVLGWLTPRIVASGSLTMSLRPSGTSPDAVLFMPGASATNPFAEYFLAQYRRRSAGNDAGFVADGLSLWHVDARLNASGYDYLYNNSYTAHKLLSLVEADGLNQIAQGQTADPGDLYTASRLFGPSTVPNSSRYDGSATGASMNGIGVAGTTMAAYFHVSLPVPVQVSRQGRGTGTVTGTSAAIQCGTVCAASVDSGSRVVLTARPATGSVFTGWSGACSGTSTVCVLSPSAAATVTATFELPTFAVGVTRLGRGSGTVRGPSGLDCGLTCSARYSVGTQVTLTAVASAQSDFAGWSGHCSGAGPTCTVTMSAARMVRAEFSPKQYVVNLRQAGSAGRIGGLPYGVTCPGGCSFPRDAGSVVQLWPLLSRGQRFVGWSGACTGTGICRLAIDGTKSVTATFAGP
ncbi:M6 family metalloprotease domain-containing protein [uncultured Sphaerotilus sp.]|uniref:M6 family metalloprotease domain-containing protein n=1 Tax=uncultured Sphaerotilus sp. TaxID=474984 RepID=UPI0030CA4C73